MKAGQTAYPIMSVDQLSSRQRPRRSDDAKLVRYEDFIEGKIQSTRRMVKAVDLASALVTLVASVLAYLLVVAVAEHWIVPGGFTVPARTALFAILVIGIAYFVYERVWSLLVRAINPVYAAHAIEQGTPSLKNSLINLLFFRQRRVGISDAVYRTLEEQAAQRLTRAPVETTVDRSLLIRLGYVLLGVVALAGLYKVFSPKDPLIAAERILLPWADILPASRVTIAAVTPGSVTVSRGESVDVSAEVHGVGDDDAVVLRYTTDDGQVVGKAIPMRPAGDGLRYACRVADEADGAQSFGLTRNLKYRLEAGDARSLDYAIKVVSAPSILVERVDYHYPPYTRYVDRTVDHLGDIHAIEGTRMTIHARANGVIRVADVDFDADGRPDLRMTLNGNEASAAFELGLRDREGTPLHASYVLRFTNEDGRANRDPVKHSITVDRDYDPEAAVLMPKEKAIDARLDEPVVIEVEARDPDFLLSAVRLRGEAAGQSVLDEPLLKGEYKGRFTSRYSFVANAHGLHAGDVVQYWVEAADNRAPKPNVTASEKRTIRILSRDPGRQPPPDRLARNDRQQPKPGAEQPGGQQEQGGQQGEKNQGEKNQGEAAGQNDRANQQQGGDSAGGQQQAGKNQQPQNGEKQQGDGEGGKGGEQSAGKESQQSKGDAKSGGEGKAANGQGGDQKGNEQKSGENGQGGAQSKSSEGSSNQQHSKGEQTGAGASGSQSSKDTARPDGARPDDSKKQEGEKGRSGEGEKAQQQSQPGDQKTAVSSEGDNDGEAFERIQKHMEQSGELKKDEKAGSEKAEGEKGKKGEGEKSQKEAAKDKNDGAGKSADGESASADGKSGAKPGDTNQKQQPGQQGNDQSEGAGAKTRGDDVPQKKEQASDSKDQKQSPGGQQNSSKGPAGAGDEKQSQGPPNSQPGMKPTEKHEQSGSKEGSNKQEPPAGANGKKESDSSGDQGGDKAGGGEEGAGQKAPREGTGSAGQHQSADNGSGESAEKGKGDTSPNGGKDAKSDHKTGSSDGKTPGQGTKQKDGSGDKDGGKPGDENASARDGENAAGEKGDKAGSKDGKPNGVQSKADGKDKPADQHPEKDVGKQGDQKGGERGKRKDGEQQGKAGSASDGGGQPGGAVNPQPSITGSAPEGDAANLEYARKQTDLVLDKLSDQLNKNKVDDRMLKELGWTRDDLRRFVERWQQRKVAAERDGPTGEAAKRELEDALRSLGLQREKLQQNAVQKDSMRDLKQGYRGAVPLEYRERLRAYNQGVSRAHRDGE
jgi:hypothetical protein